MSEGMSIELPRELARRRVGVEASHERGFTLVQMMIVGVLVAIFAAFSLPSPDYNPVFIHCDFSAEARIVSHTI